ncbi:MAG: hypothetical protein P8I55_16380 [Crocinitomix sp.]|nr:hypothetical protein [Crocinitomix sp.]
MNNKELVKKKKVQDLLSELASGDTKRQVKAVQGLKVHGNETVIEPLLAALVKKPADELYSVIVDLLNTPKSSKVPAEIAKALVDKRFVDIRHTLLTTIWNSGLDYRPYLKEIVTAGTEGEMMDALECITIIENIEGEMTEDQLFEPLIVLTEYLGSTKDDGPKLELLREVTATLQNINNML